MKSVVSEGKVSRISNGSTVGFGWRHLQTHRCWEMSLSCIVHWNRPTPRCQMKCSMDSLGHDGKRQQIWGRQMGSREQRSMPMLELFFPFLSSFLPTYLPSFLSLSFLLLLPLLSPLLLHLIFFLVFIFVIFFFYKRGPIVLSQWLQVFYFKHYLRERDRRRKKSDPLIWNPEERDL